MTLSDLSIKNPVLAWMIMAAVALFGFIAYSGLGVSQMPDVDAPTLNVSTGWEGAAPEVMEKEITDIIEEAALGVEGVEEITSSSSRGRSNVTVSFSLDRNIDAALQDLQSTVNRAVRKLPDDADIPVITKSNPEDMPIMWLSVSGSRDKKFIMEYTRDHVKDAFSTIKGVSEVSLGGYLDPKVRVWLDTKKMASNEITAEDIISAVEQGHREFPAGNLDNGARETNIRVMGEAGTVDELASIIIPARKGSPIWKTLRIKDVARVEDGLEDLTRLARTDGKESVGLGVRKQRGENSVQVAERVKKKVSEIQKSLPEGLELEIRSDGTKFIREAADEMIFVILLSVILTSLVCWLFLGSLRSAFSVFLTIPMSILGAFFLMRVMGFTLNTFTFLAVSLVIGIVVDDAIMMAENITRHFENGESKIRSSIRGAREITFAAVAATVAILAIFVPVIFMEGVIGRYLFQFGVTISAAVAISLLGALTLTPMLSSQLMEKNKGSIIDKPFNVFKGWYRRTLESALNHRKKVVIAAFFIFGVSLFLGLAVKKEFAPTQDVAIMIIRVQLAPGSALKATDKAMLEIEKIVTSRPEVSAYFANISAGSAFMFVSLFDKKERPVDPATGRRLSQQQLSDVLRKEFKQVKGIRSANIQDPSVVSVGAGRRGYPVEFIVTGPEWDNLSVYAAALAEEMDKSGLMTDADTDYRTGMSELRIIPDRKKAFDRGVSISSIGIAVGSVYGGVSAGQFTRGGKRYDIIVQYKPEERKNAEKIKNLMLRNSRGEMIKLSEVADFVEEKTLVSITRQDRERAVRVYANVATGSSQGEAIEFTQKKAKEIIPEGYTIKTSGSTKGFSDTFISLAIALMLGILISYMVLASQFNSLVHPVTVLMALPFSLTGALIALFISGNTINIYSAIGIILLMGIVKKNSILLVDFTIHAREQGMDTKEAILYACPLRLRPIIMTSVATIAAAIPPALALGPGAESRIPMSVVIIGGVIVSTLFTLFVVPMFYSLLSGFENKEHFNEVKNVMEEFK
ncbi:MAG: efflux RND transporter permease subunit [Candidatus Goldbacteria bacterium]|nr:efflux RND transporter permease subunit [Candidatus Goldiibacteriota bacterium]